MDYIHSKRNPMEEFVAKWTGLADFYKRAIVCACFIDSELLSALTALSEAKTPAEKYQLFGDYIAVARNLLEPQDEAEARGKIDDEMRMAFVIDLIHEKLLK